MKNKTTAAILAFFLGGIGIHRFYLGQPILGIVYLLLCWTFIPAFIGLIDFIVILLCSDQKFNYRYNKLINQQIERRFRPSISKMRFPDRNEAIVWHSNAIEKGFFQNNLELVNLSYAKLIESIRQQNINEPEKYNDLLEAVRAEYNQFRKEYQLGYPAQFLPPSQRKRKRSDDSGSKLVNISSQTEGNTTTMTIDLNEEELIKRIKDGSFDAYEYSTDECIEDVVGFYGNEQFSKNKKYRVVYSDGYSDNDKWKKGQFAVLNGDKLLFKKRLERPNDCHISNNGISICCDWLNIDDLEGKFIAFDLTGKEIFSRKTTAGLGSSGISNDGRIALFETYNSDTEDADQIFVVDLEQGKIISKFDRPTAFIKTEIDTESGRIRLIDNRGFIFEIDFTGNQTNQEEYDSQILQKGSIYDKLWFYSDKPAEEKFQDKNYLDILYKALKDNDCQYSYGFDRLYRMIGEYYEANNDIKKTIEYWEKAIEVNPKVGVKRKLDKLRSEK